MRMIRRLLCVLLATVIISGISMPLETKAATTVTTVKFDSFGDQWETYNSKYVWLVIGTRGSGTTSKYQYKVYVNGKAVKSGYSKVYKRSGSAKEFCKAYIPSNTFFTVRVRAKRGGSWSKWSGHTAIGPGLKGFTLASAKGNTIKFAWKRMAGVTDYAAYRKDDITNKWVKIKSVSASSTSITINMSSWSRNRPYTVEVRPRKKINGKYVSGKGWDYLWIYRESDGSYIFTH